MLRILNRNHAARQTRAAEKSGTNPTMDDRRRPVRLSRMETLSVDARHPIYVENGGLFISPGHGAHPDRVIKSFELILVRSGTLTMEEAGRNLSASTGETILLFPGRRHRGVGAYGP